MHSPYLYMLPLALLLACNGNETDGSSGSTGPSTSDTSTATTDTPTGEPVTASSTTATTSEPTTTPPTTGDTTGDLTTGTTTTTGTTSGDTSDTGDTSTTGTTTDLVLDPASLTFFELPINSLRHAVGGFDPAQQTCVSVIFFGDIETEVCDAFETGNEFGFPYLVITPNAAPPCMDWDYAGNVTLDAATGCVQLTSHDPLAIAIDMQMTVTGAPFTGTISVASP